MLGIEKSKKKVVFRTKERQGDMISYTDHFTKRQHDMPSLWAARAEDGRTEKVLVPLMSCNLTERKQRLNSYYFKQ